LKRTIWRAFSRTSFNWWSVCAWRTMIAAAMCFWSATLCTVKKLERFVDYAINESLSRHLLLLDVDPRPF
jgi:hypothetical protein